MNIRALIKNNLINLVILIAIVVFRIITGIMFNPDTNKKVDNIDKINVAINVVTIIAGVFWAIYTIYSNYSAINEDSVEDKKILDQLRHRIKKAGNIKFFIEERKILLNSIESIDSRQQYFDNMDKDSRLRELFNLTKNQLIKNVTNASEYMETYDYYSGKDSSYLKGLCEDSQQLIDKFNKLVELSISYDDTTTDYDTREIDDMINALEKMRETGKARLGS